jgi:pimeloyl-ACP methyl ester carboxylesterase
MPWFEHPNGRIYYETEGDGPAIMVLPGWSESIDTLASLRAALAQEFRVIAADLPGSGRSEPQPRSYSATYFDEDADAVLALLDRLGVDEAHFAGFSDGGEVAVIAAIQRPAIVRSVVAWGAAGQAPAMDLIDAFHDLIDAPVGAFEAFSSHLRQQYGEATARSMSQSVANAWRTMAAEGDISQRRATSINCPALIIAGELDAIAPPEAVSRLARAIPAGEFIEVKGAGHAVHQSDDAGFNETVLEWLRGH